MTAAPSPRDFGAVEGRDSTAALQRWLDAIPGSGGKGYGAPGTYLYSDTLVVHSDTEIVAARGHRFVLKNTRTDIPHILNENLVWTPALWPADGMDPRRVDHNIAFRGVVFEGNPVDAVAPGNHIAMIGVTDIAYTGCIFRHHRSYMCEFSNCYGVTVERCEVYDWGPSRPYTGEYGRLDAKPAIFLQTPCYHVRARRNWLHDGTGIGIWIDGNGRWAECTFNTVAGCSEAGIVGGPIDSRFDDNLVYNAVRDDVSGHCYEMSGGGYTFRRNKGYRADGSCAYFTDIHDVPIEDNDLRNPTDPGYEAKGAALTIRTYDSSNSPRNVRINRNLLHGQAAHAITFYNQSEDTAALMQVSGRGNDARGAQWADGQCGCYPSEETALSDPSVVDGLFV